MTEKREHDGQGGGAFDPKEDKIVPTLREGEQESEDALDAPIERHKRADADMVEPQMGCPEGFDLQDVDGRKMCVKVMRQDISEEAREDLGQEGSKSTHAQVRKEVETYSTKHAEEIKSLREELEKVKKTVIRKAPMENHIQTPVEEVDTFEGWLSKSLTRGEQ